MSRVAKDIRITPEIRALVTAARRAQESVLKAEGRMRAAADRRKDAIAGLSELGMSARQIGELLGVSEASVYQARHRRSSKE